MVRNFQLLSYIAQERNVNKPERWLKYRRKAKKGKTVAQPNQMKIYEVIKPNGEVLMVKGLNEFCKSEGIDASNMCNVAKGKFKQHKGYKCKLINT